MNSCYHIIIIIGGEFNLAIAPDHFNAANSNLTDLQNRTAVRIAGPNMSFIQRFRCIGGLVLMTRLILSLYTWIHYLILPKKSIVQMNLRWWCYWYQCIFHALRVVLSVSQVSHLDLWPSSASGTATRRCSSYHSMIRTSVRLRHSTFQTTTSGNTFNWHARYEICSAGFMHGTWQIRKDLWTILLCL